MKAIVFDNGQGGVAVVYPVEGSGLTIEEVMEKDVPKNVAKKIVEIDGSLDRTFRGAWKFSQVNGVDVDMPKAREIWKNKLREARKPKLEALDVEAMRAVEDGDNAKTREVKQKKQALRDVTVDPRIEAAQTYEELKAVWPEVLN